ncbi:MAG: iron ABC transporter substrate-binding protein [Halanaeroarchaeum sp.]
MKRRAFLGTVGTGAIGVVAGCLGGTGGSSTGTTPQFDGETGHSSPRDSVSLEDLPPLSGELTIYLGRGEGGLYKALLDHFQNERYPDLTLNVRRDASSTLANTIVEEERNGRSPADVFWSIDAGALGTVASRGIATTLTDEVTSLVPDRFHDPNHRWTGISGRARSIPYNTDRFDESEIPDSIDDVPRTSRFENDIGWAPTYGAFQSFVTAMRYIRGEAATRRWLGSMLDAGVGRYSGEFLVTNAVAEGELDVGLANHYYALRLQKAKPDAPLGLAFTRNDAGALVNSSGALVLESSQQPDRARNLVRHMLTVEVQQFLADEAYEYPLVDGVSPPGGLPSVEELNPPPFDLTKLADVQETLALLRDTGVL